VRGEGRRWGRGGEGERGRLGNWEVYLFLTFDFSLQPSAF